MYFKITPLRTSFRLTENCRKYAVTGTKRIISNENERVYTGRFEIDIRVRSELTNEGSSRARRGRWHRSPSETSTMF